MPKLRWFIAGSLVIAGVATFFLLNRTPQRSTVVGQGTSQVQGDRIAASAATATTSSTAATAETPAAPVTATEKFSDWTERYAQADAAGRAALLAEGLELVKARRAEMLKRIQTNPEQALRDAVPYAIRKQLPAEIVAQLEQPVSAAGVFSVKHYCDPEHKHEGPLPPTEREFKTDGHLYSAYVYGWRDQLASKASVALQGIEIDEYFAVSADAARVLDAAETADVVAAGQAQLETQCSVCGQTAATAGALALVDMGAGNFQMACAEHVGTLNEAIQYAQTAVGYGNAVGQLLAQSDDARLRQLSQLAQFQMPAQYFSGVSGSTNPPPIPPGFLGQRRLLLIPAQYGDEASPPITQQALANAGNNVADRYNAYSYGYEQMVTTVTPPVVLPQRMWFYDETGNGRIVNDAIAQAVRLGYASGSYDFIYVITTPFPAANYGGISSGLSFGTGPLVHEIGHNNGVVHANYFDNTRPPNPTQPNPALPFDTDSQVGHPDLNGPFFNSEASPVTGGNGSITTYGDQWDTMGGGGSDFSVPMKLVLGWLPTNFVRAVTSSETNRLYAFDQGSVIPGRIYAITTDRRDGGSNPGPNGPYWLSHRRAINNAWLDNGVLIQHRTGTQTLLLDTTPGTADERDDSAVVVGRTFTDPEAKIHITPTALGGTGANSWIDVVIHRGTFPGNNPPVISSFEADVLNVPVGTTVTFTVDASDADGDPLAYHFNYSDGAFGSNAPVNSRTFTAAGNFVVTCEVSDMKGGVDSTHLIVKVGNPTTRNLSGRVVDNNGEPVRGARVHNGISPITAAGYRYGISDARGYYTIPNLAAGSYEISGFAYRYRTEPLNYNFGTVVVGATDLNNINLLALQIPRVSVTVLTNGSEPSVQGIFRVSRTGPTTTNQVVRLVVQSPDGAGFTSSATTTVNIPIGQSFADVTITPSNNAVGDGGRNVTLTLLNQTNYIEIVQVLTNGNIIFQTNNITIPGWERRPRRTDNATTWFQTYAQYVIDTASATMLISDDDPPGTPSVSIAAANTGVVEGSRNVATFVVSRVNAPITNDLVVNIGLGGTATNGVDYLPLPPSITIPAGLRRITFSIVPINNYFVETSRTVQASILAGPGYTPSGGSATITIVDDDLPNVAVFSPDPIAGRSNNNGRWTIVRSGDLTQPLVVNYLLTGTAISGSDYQPLPGSATIPANANSVDVTVVPTPTPSSPGPKTVVLVVSDSPSYNIAAEGRSTVRIADIVPTVNVTASGAVTEGGTGNFTITRTAPTNAAITVFYNVAGTANPNTDYAGIGNSAVIPAGATSVVVQVVTVNDNFREFTGTGQNNSRLNEHEFVQLALLPDDAYEVGNNDQAQITITDNDNGFPMVGFMTASSVVRENAGSVSIPVRIGGNPTNQPSLPIRILWSITGGTAIISTNYNGATSGELQFISNRVVSGAEDLTDQNQFLNFSILNDGVRTTDRTLILTLDYYTGLITNTNGTFTAYPTNAIIGDYKSHTLVIEDVNLANVTISAIAPQARESGPVSGVFRITRTGSTASPLTVNVFSDGTAEPGADYVAIPPQITIPAGTNSVDILITPIDDVAQEQAETVILRLHETPDITGAGSAQVVIVDNDGTIQFTSVTYQFDEAAGNAVIDVLRTGNTNVVASVDYLITAGTAANGPDYLGTNGTLNFAIGESLKQILIPLVDDFIVEPTETFFLTLANVSGGAPLAGQTATTVSITDNDSAIEFASATFAAYEDRTNALITVRRVGLTNSAATVEFFTADGTAGDGSDYTAVSTTLNFPAGVTTQVVAIALLNDAVLEGDETVLLTLTNLVGAVYGPNSNAVLSIVEDETRVEIASSAYSVIEYASAVTIEIRRLGGSEHPVSVGFTTLNGTATNGLDFVQTPGVLAFTGDGQVTLTNGSGQVVFVPGETNKILNLQILDDVLGEGDETLQFVLTNLTGPGGLLAGTFALGAQTNTEITIIDDEQPGFVDYAYAPVVGTGGLPTGPGGGPTTTVSGTVVNATTGTGLGGVAITIGGQSGVSAGNGSFSILNVPVGSVPVNASLAGYAPFTDTVVLLNQPVNTYNFSISPAITGAGIRLVLTWGAEPSDLDSYLQTPVISGQSYTVAYFSPGSLISPPFAALDVDDVTGFGPETITITNVFPGTYSYFINRFSGIGTIAGSGARVQVYTDAGLVNTITAPDTGAGAGDYWHVLQIDGATRAITIINAISNSVPTAQSNLPPTIASQPQNLAVDVGAQAVFNVVAGGSQPLFYQWQRNAANLPGQTNVALVLSNVSTNDAGAYRVVVSNAFGTLISSNAQLVVNTTCNNGINGGLVYALALFTNENKVVLGGSFTTVNGFSLPRIARLTPEGLVDSSFNPGVGANSNVTAVAVQPDGKVVIGGEFTSVGGSASTRLARLAVDGSFDSTFTVGVGPNAVVQALALQPDGKLLVAGDFTNYGGNPGFSYIVRLNTNGTLDNTFQATLNNRVLAVAVQPDGAILVGGCFTTANGAPRSRIARLTSAGVNDPTFNPGTAASDAVRAIALQSTGNIIVGGAFTFFNGVPAGHLVRLSPAGAVDGTFLAGAGADAPVNAIAVAPKDKVYVAGSFAMFDGYLRSGFTRLTPGGAVDLVFKPGSGANGPVYAAIAQPDSALVIGGNFTSVNSVPRTGIARIHGDEKSVLVELSLTSASYTVLENAGPAVITAVRSGNTNQTLNLQLATLNGTAVSGVDFTGGVFPVSFAASQTVATVNIPIADNGTVEGNRSFQVLLTNAPPNVILYAPTNALVTIEDDESAVRFASAGYLVTEGANAVVVVERIGTTNGAASVEVNLTGGSATLGADFTYTNVIVNFAPGDVSHAVIVGTIEDMVVDGPDTVELSLQNATNVLLVAPSVTVVTIKDFEPLPGVLDPNFNSANGADDLVRSVAVQPNGKILIGGAFSNYAGTARIHIARLNTNGTLDVSFNPGGGADGLVTGIGVLGDGRIMIGGAFTNVNSNSMNRLARLMPGGGVDFTFNPPGSIDSALNTLSVQSSSKVLVGGAFSLPAAGIARLQTNGSVDISFLGGVGANGPVHAVAADGQGMVYLGGAFTQVNGVSAARLARLNSSGQVDTNFASAAITNGIVFALAVQPDGKLIVGGEFAEVGGTNRNRLARLHHGGSLDAGFDAGVGPSGPVFALALQPNGRILVGGGFTNYAGSTVGGLVRIENDGSFDATYNVGGVGADGPVYGLALLPNGSVAVGGDFETFNGFARRGVAVVFGDGPFVQFESRRVLPGGFEATIRSQVGALYVLEATTDFISWSPLSTNQAFGSTLTFFDPGFVLNSNRFYRASVLLP